MESGGSGVGSSIDGTPRRRSIWPTAPPPVPVTIAAAPQNVTVDLKRTAMIVIDMQNDFCAKGGWVDHLGVDYTPDRAPIAPLQRLLPALRDAGVPVIWLNWGNRPDLAEHAAQPAPRLQARTARASASATRCRATARTCWRRTAGPPRSSTSSSRCPRDIKVDKYRISGFWDTPLDSILRNLGISTLLFAGVNTDQCVLHSLTDANFLGYDCLLVEDCCATTSPDFCTEATLWNVKKCFGFVTDSGKILKALKK